MDNKEEFSPALRQPSPQNAAPRSRKPLRLTPLPGRSRGTIPNDTAEHISMVADCASRSSVEASVATVRKTVLEAEVVDENLAASTTTVGDLEEALRDLSILLPAPE